MEAAGNPQGRQGKPLPPWPQSSCVREVSRLPASTLSCTEPTLTRHPVQVSQKTYRAKVFACTEWPKLKLPDLGVRPAWHKAGSNGFRSACARVYVLRERVSGRCRLVILCVQRCRLPHEGGVWVSSRLVGDVRPGSLCKGCWLGLVFDLGQL